MNITAKLGNMKKAAKWDIYCKNEFSGNIIMQSSHRIAAINPRTVTGLLGKHCSLGPQLKHATEMMGATTVPIPPELMVEILIKLSKTR